MRRRRWVAVESHSGGKPTRRSPSCYNCARAASSDRDAATLAKELISYDAV